MKRFLFAATFLALACGVAGAQIHRSSPRLANANFGALAQHYRSARDNALALAILDGRLDERDIPRYSQTMTGNKQVMTALSASDKNEQERERKQREWMRRKGIE